MSGPMLPRRTRAPRRIEIGTGEPTYPVIAQDYYKRIYFEAGATRLNYYIYLSFEYLPRIHYLNYPDLLDPTYTSRIIVPVACFNILYLTKFNTGRLRPEVQPLTLSHTISAEKVPLLYTFY